MKKITWSLLKNEQLKLIRGVSFEELLDSELIAIRLHKTRFNQKVMLFHYRDYVWVVPFVEEEHVFLKTLYPSRRLTKLYREGKL